MIKKFCLFVVFFNTLFFLSCFSSDGEEVSEQEDAPPPSLHVLLTTIGRPTLLRMLHSLEDQLISSDYLTLVFDAKDEGQVFDAAVETLSRFQCQCTVIMEPVNLGYWGHEIRNKYNELQGDFILHGDDDDIYLPNVFSEIRQIVATDLNALYIFSMINYDQHVLTGNPIAHAYIGTPNGVIPSHYNSKARWGYYYGGDFSFYQQLQKVVPKINYVNLPIYLVRP